ncbi:MAG: transglycosylase SLT domain-containing protein [Burkholderiaceae bacterium]
MRGKYLVPIMAGLCLGGPSFAESVADRALLQMREAYAARQADRLTELLPLVTDHALAPLARYWEMRTRLETADPSEVRRVLQHMPGTYWEDRLRNDWLLQLGKDRQWALFEAELPAFRMKDDRQIGCYAQMLDAAAGRRVAAEAARETEQLWLAQRSADDGCATAVKAFLDSGHLTEEAVWRRARLGMELNRQDVVRQAVALLDPAWEAQVETIAREPARYLDDKITALRPRTREFVTLAIIRLASSDPAAAAEALLSARWMAQLTREERDWAWGVVGKRAAQRRLPEALSYFSHAPAPRMSDDHLAWRARAALRAQAWAQVTEAIQAMGPEQQQEPAWMYWQARALQAQPQTDPIAATVRARELLERIAAPTGFYELLATEALGRPIVEPPAPPALTDQERSQAGREPGLQRALAAMRLGLRSEGVREWHYTVALHDPGGQSERELLAAADLACRQQLWDRCINTSERTRGAIDQQQRYPMPYRNQVQQRADDIGLDPAYVYGLIRQESRFVTDARSQVGASGLMQVMPATARWTARRIGLTPFRAEQIRDRDTNIRIGTAYLGLALQDFGGSMPLAAAAYNAGPARARSWRDGPELPAEIWIENIPFDETRDYVKQVLANTTHYAALLTGQPQSLRSRLGTVGPRPADGPAPDSELP